MTSLQNDQFTKWPMYRMTSLQNDQCTEWPVHKMTSVQNDQFTKWPVYRMTSSQNDKLEKWLVGKMTSWKNDLLNTYLTNWQNDNLKNDLMPKLTGISTRALFKNVLRSFCQSLCINFFFTFKSEFVSFVLAHFENIYFENCGSQLFNIFWKNLLNLDYILGLYHKTFYCRTVVS